MQIALVTSCVAGIAQSRMAASAIVKAAKMRGYSVFVEEQGGHKIPKRLTPEQIEEADVVIIARAVAISGKNRFNGKLILELPVYQALRDPNATLDKAAAMIKQAE